MSELRNQFKHLCLTDAAKLATGDFGNLGLIDTKKLRCGFLYRCHSPA